MLKVNVEVMLLRLDLAVKYGHMIKEANDRLIVFLHGIDMIISFFMS